MRTSSSRSFSPLELLLPLSAAASLGAAGCQVTSHVAPGRDAGVDGALPPGVDAPLWGTDTSFPTDRGLPPPDTDGDGLSDDDERARGTNPFEVDTDGDGYDDGVEVIAETDPRDRWSGIPRTDFYVVLPFEDPAIHRELDFRARLGRADVFFLVDTTGSMGGAIENVRTSLTTTIVPAIVDSIADAVIGVGDYRDFPISPYGDSSDWPILVRQTMTPDVPSVSRALALLVAGGGADGPESTTQGLFVSVADPCPVPDGGFGAACFREMSHPIIVVVTDVAFHNGPDPVNDYRGVTGARSWAETITTLREHEVRVVGVAVNAWGWGGARNDLQALAEFTGSYDAAGNLTVFDSDSGNVDTAVVGGIVDLVGAVNQDVSSMSRDEPSDAVDATRFITAITPVRSSRPTTFDATTFYDVPGGTTVTFDVTFENTFRPAASTVQIYRAYIDVRDVLSSTTLDTRNVYVVIPPEGGIIF